MKKLNIDIYSVTDQKVYDDDGNIVPIHHVIEKLESLISQSFMKNKVKIKWIDVTKDTYDENIVKDNLTEGVLLPWTYFNGELEFYNGFSESMVYQEAMRQMNFKITKK